MSLALADLPTDPEALRAFALACQSELATATAELEAAKLAVQLRTLEIEKLKFQIAKLRRMQFGRSSERLGRRIEQLELRLEELEAGEAEAISKAAPRTVRCRCARAPGRSGSRCRTICRALRSCTNRKRTAHAAAQSAAVTWPGWARTSQRCSIIFRAASR
jgi:transposase IS166 family protein